MFLLSFLACEAFHIGVEDTNVEDSATEPTPNLIIDIEWDDDMLRINAENITGYDNIKFGIIESSSECDADLVNGCWTGEDCYIGHTPPEGQESNPRYTQCHSLPSTDSEYDDSGYGSFSSELEYSSNNFNDIVTIHDAVENMSVTIGNGNTGFPAPTDDLNYETMVTYYLKANIIGADGTNPERCWAWGVDPSYFDPLECNTPLPISLGNSPMIRLSFE